MEALTQHAAQSLEQQHHVQMYGRFPVTFERGEGCVLYDTNGKEYLDALAGIAVNNIGHCHPRWVQAVQGQANRLVHVSNLYYTEPQARLAKRLTEVSGMDRVFFCNSGAEANEGAIKLARKIGHAKGRKGHIISFQQSFHGRTVATIALGQEKYYSQFRPIPDEPRQVDLNDLDAVKKLVDQDTVGIIVEPIQGEGGIHPSHGEFLKGLRQLCDEHELTLIFDEVQSGMGRTGYWYAWQYYGVQPDILTSAKGLGGGFPIGAVLAREATAQHLQPGDHGTTYGGNPLGCAASLAVLDVIEEEGLLDAATRMGAYLREQLEELQMRYPDDIKDVRGVGLMLGAEMAYPSKPLVGRMMHHGVLTSATANTVVRMVPPLIITRHQIDHLVTVFEKAIQEEKESQQNA